MNTTSQKEQGEKSAPEQQMLANTSERAEALTAQVAPALAAQRIVMSRGLRSEDVLALQRSVGNRAVHGLLARRADRFGELAANGVAADTDAAIDRAASSTEQPLPENVRSRFERSLGVDLSNVSVHIGGESAEAAEAVGAKAYTVGQDIHFGASHYAPADPEGVHLLAHEVAHTVQNRGGAPGPTGKLEVSTPADSAEVEADRAADAIVSGGSVNVGVAPAAIHRDAAPPVPQTAPQPTPDPAAAKLHDTEQYGDAIYAFKKHNSSLGDDALSKIRSGIVKVTDESKTYEVAYSFFDFYSSLGNSIRQMTSDEETKARKADRYAETDTTLGFTTTTLRSDVLGWEDKRLAVLLLHEFSHGGHVSGDISGSGSYQEGQSYGIEYFYAEVAGDSARMKKIEDIVTSGEVLGFSKAGFLAKFQEDFKVTYALLTAFSEVVKRGSSPHLPFPDLTPADAQLLESQVVTSFQSPSGALAKYIAHVRTHLASFKLPPI